LDSVITVAPEPETDIIELDEALDRLGTESPRQARIVEMRFFGGMTADEAADVLGVSTRTVERDWRYARAWLFRELAADGEESRRGAVDE
jgi:RNA polymerase sigma factor (TIGR02999 family)